MRENRNRYDRNDKRDNRKGNFDDHLQPLEIKVDFPNDMAALERAMRKLTRMIKKEGVFKEFMWRRYKREAKEKKPKYFDK
jgi:hypothetical protein